MTVRREAFEGVEPASTESPEERRWRTLSAPERGSLLELCFRARPRPTDDMARMERFGLVAFVRETASGTTWFAATGLGRLVLAVGIANGDAAKLTEWSRTYGRGDVAPPPPESSGRVEGYGVRGMASKPWRRTFASREAMLAWAEKNSAEIHGTRSVDS